MTVDYEDIQKIVSELKALSIKYRDAINESYTLKAEYEKLDEQKKIFYAMCYDALDGSVDSSGKPNGVTSREILAHKAEEYVKHLIKLQEIRTRYYAAWARERAIKLRIDVIESEKTAYQSIMKIQ